MPIEALTASVRPSTVNGRPRTATSRAPRLAASSPDLRAGPEQREIVAAEARQHVLAPRRVRQALGHRAQQRVARGMTERAVHQLEAVQIDREERQLAARARCGGNRLGGALGEQSTVAEASERIARRELLDARLGELARGDIGLHAAIAAPAPRAVGERQTAQRLPDDAAWRPMS